MEHDGILSEYNLEGRTCFKSLPSHYPTQPPQMQKKHQRTTPLPTGIKGSNIALEGYEERKGESNS